LDQALPSDRTLQVPCQVVISALSQIEIVENFPAVSSIRQVGENESCFETMQEDLQVSGHEKTCVGNNRYRVQIVTPDTGSSLSPGLLRRQMRGHPFGNLGGAGERPWNGFHGNCFL